MYLRTDDECVWAADRICGMTGGKTISHTNCTSRKITQNTPRRSHVKGTKKKMKYEKWEGKKSRTKSSLLICQSKGRAGEFSEPDPKQAADLAMLELDRCAIINHPSIINSAVQPNRTSR